jgi:hypothetical protein
MRTEWDREPRQHQGLTKSSDDENSEDNARSSRRRCARGMFLFLLYLQIDKLCVQNGTENHDNTRGVHEVQRQRERPQYYLVTPGARDADASQAQGTVCFFFYFTYKSINYAYRMGPRTTTTPGRLMKSSNDGNGHDSPRYVFFLLFFLPMIIY